MAVKSFALWAKTRTPFRLWAHCQQREFLLEVHTTIQMTILDDKLVTLLQLVPTDYTDETTKVVDLAEGSHYQLIWRDRLHASMATGAVQPGE